jgi:chemotaxis protein CheX
MTSDTTHAAPPDLELVAAIRSATENVFATMLNLEASAGDAFVEKEEAVPASGVISILGIAGSWVGSGSVSCSAVCAEKLASHLLMAEYDAVNEDVLDAVAEVANMIIGNVKAQLKERLGSMGLSTPTVIYGRNFQTRGTRNQAWTVVPFQVAGERICVQICIVPNPDASGRQTRTFAAPIPHVHPAG